MSLNSVCLIDISLLRSFIWFYSDFIMISFWLTSFLSSVIMLDWSIHLCSSFEFLATKSSISWESWNLILLLSSFLSFLIFVISFLYWSDLIFVSVYNLFKFSFSSVNILTLCFFLLKSSETFLNLSNSTEFSLYSVYSFSRLT